MGLFGGKSEDELRTSGTPGTARISYSDDTFKRRDDSRFAKVKLQLKIDGGAARGRELEGTKWVPSDRIPCRGETVSIRIDPDDIDDWAWGDAAMYSPARSAADQPSAIPGLPASPFAPGETPGVWDMTKAAMGAWNATGGMDPKQLEQMIQTAMQQGGVSVQHIEVDADGTTRSYTSGSEGASFSMGPQPSAGPGPASGSTNDTATRLRKVDELHARGLIDAAERERLRARIIESI